MRPRAHELRKTDYVDVNNYYYYRFTGGEGATNESTGYNIK